MSLTSDARPEWLQHADPCPRTTAKGLPCPNKRYPGTPGCHVHQHPEDPNRGRSGIYQLAIGRLFYIGSTINLASRRAGHINQLRKNRHANYRLQGEYNRTHTFEFTVLEYCQPDKRLDREQTWLDEWHGRPGCANIAKVAEIN